MDNSKEPVTVGCCNGLICVLMDRCRFLLWNPSTRECKELPEFCPGVKTLRKQGRISTYGFGFDESSGDYKIFAAFNFFCRRNTSMRRVYSLKADSWRGDESFKNGFPLDDIHDDLAGKFVSGNLHWIIDLEREFKWEIVFFDLKSETFGDLELPSCMEGYSIARLGVLEECLCLFFDYPFGFDIWIWKEYGVEDSWSKLLTISYLYTKSWRLWNPESPLLVLSTDEVLFRYGSTFYIYNVKDDWVRQLHINNIDHTSHLFEAEVYIESLVSPLPDDDDILKWRST